MTRILLLAILCLCVCSRALGGVYEGYKFSLNGKAEEIRVMTTEGPEPVPGDVAKVGEYYLCLEEPGAYDFETRGDGALLRVMPDGKKIVVACTVEMASENNGVKQPATNPLASMSDAEFKALRGVSLERWTNGMNVLLTKLDLAKTCLLVRGEALDRESVKLRSFPDATSHLILESGGTSRCSDFSSLHALKRLRFLRLDRLMIETFDFKGITDLPLEHLSLPWVREIRNLESLTALKQLKTLHASRCGYLGDASFLSQLPELRQFYGDNAFGLWGETPAAFDLRGLAALPKLVSFDVGNSLVKHLPQVTLPALKKASIMWTQAPGEEVEVFLKANPQAVIASSVNAELAATLRTVTRLRVRSGGVRLRVGALAKTYYDSTDEEVIRTVASHLKVEESKGTRSCNCQENLTLEFYEDERSLAIAELHPGHALRWRDSIWPDVGRLTPESVTYLADWLAKQGCLGPKYELERELADRRYSERYEALVPKVLRELERDPSIDSEEQKPVLQAAVTQHIPDASERALLMLRLYGSDDRAGYRAQPLINALWSSVPSQVMRELIPKIDPNTEEGLGAAHWLFGIGHARLWKDEWSTIEPFARRALTSTQRAVRRHTLVLLRDIGGPALPLLREIVTNPQPLQKDPQEDLTSSYGNERLDPVRVELPPQASDQVIAALYLTSLQAGVMDEEVAKIRIGLSLEMVKVWEEYLEAYRKRHSPR